MNKLVITGGSLKGNEIEIKEQIFKIGRDNSNDLVLNDPLASREHAIIKLKNRSYYIFDLDSHNGVYINSIRFKHKKLFNNDMIRIGKNFFKFIEGAVKPPQTGIQFSTVEFKELAKNFNMKINEIKFNEYIDFNTAKSEMSSLVGFYDFLQINKIDEFTINLKTKYNIEKIFLVKVEGKPEIAESYQDEDINETVLDKLKNYFNDDRINLISSKNGNRLTNFIIAPLSNKKFFLMIKEEKIGEDELKEIGYHFLLIKQYYNR